MGVWDAAVTGAHKRRDKMVKERDEKINLQELVNEEEPEDQDEEEESEGEVLDDESGEEVTEPPSEGEGEEKEEAPSINIDDLSNRLSEMEKANMGLRKAVSSIRSEKQALAAKLEQLTEILATAKQQREEQVEEEPIPKIQVEVTEDGEVYLDPAKLAPVLNKVVQPIEQQTVYTRQQIDEMGKQQEIQRSINNVVSKKPEYSEAFQDILTSYNTMIETAKNYISEQGADPGIINNTDMAARVLYNTDFEKQLNEKNLSIDDMILLDKTTDPSLFSLRLERVMEKMSASKQKKVPQDKGSINVNELDKIANKKANLVGKRATPSHDEENLSLDNIANGLSVMDLVNMPDQKFNELLNVAEE